MIDRSRILFVIPARGGSKGIPGKNIKPLNQKPLIYYSIELARQFAPDENICVSTDSESIADCLFSIDMHLPFMRPHELATDKASMHETLLHAVVHYEKQGLFFSTLVLLQPTSPFRKKEQLQEMLDIYTPDIDMLVSVSKSKNNPYFNLFEEQDNGFLALSKQSTYVSRQESPSVYAYNGAFYIINIDSLKKSLPSAFERIKKYEMDAITSVDLDTLLDWNWAEFLLEKKMVITNDF